MSKPLKLVLLYGGKSGEHEISLVSAASVLRHLDPDRYQITPIGIDKGGCMFINDYQALLVFSDGLPVKTENSKPLASLISDGKLALEADVVFPVMHGPLYEDGSLQGLLELAGIAYVGCGVMASAVSMDKDIARRLACDDRIKCARYRRVPSHARVETQEDICREAATSFGWPLFVKPCSMGSSVGIHKANNMQELMTAVSDAKRYDEEVLIEAFIEGREIELAVLENSLSHLPPKVSIPGEIRVHHGDGFYSYAAKYLEANQTDLDIPARMNESTVLQLQQMAGEIFTRLKCRGLARVDFFVNDTNGAIYFNEINTLPGFTHISMYPKLWAVSGIPYPDLLDQLVDLAINHRERKDKQVTHYQ